MNTRTDYLKHLAETTEYGTFVRQTSREALSEIAELTRQRDALLAVVYVHSADNDQNLSPSQFYAVLRGFGRDPKKESAAEFMDRLTVEAIAMCPEPNQTGEPS